MKAFGKYENLALIGSGATADVYLAQDKTLARPVALKVLKASLVSDAQAFERFLLEARSAANLFHPHIAVVLDMGETPPEIITRHMLDGPDFSQNWPEDAPVEALMKANGVCSHTYGILITL